MRLDVFDDNLQSYQPSPHLPLGHKLSLQQVTAYFRVAPLQEISAEGSNLVGVALRKLGPSYMTYRLVMERYRNGRHKQ
jgi:hypothetical protein